MAEMAPMFRPALAHAAIGDEAHVRLEPLAEGHVLHALARAGCEDAEARLAGVADGTAHAVRRYAPGQWFVVGSSRLDPAAMREKDEALGPNLTLSDQGSGRVRLSVSGPGSRELLAKGSAVDFSARAFPLGASAATLFNHIGVHVTRTGDDRFELIVLRSLAQSLWEELALLSGCAP
jgi:sarcosine oxidase, subunit gamma